MSLEIRVDTSKYDQTVEGLQSTIRRLPNRIISEASELVLNTLRKNTPVRTGRLRDSETREVRGRQALVRTNTGYGLYVERGTRYFTGRFYAERTLNEVSPKIRDLITQILRDEIK